jgi:hypothetical protein
MRSLVLILIVGAVAFMAIHHSRVRYVHNTVWIEDAPTVATVEVPPIPRIVAPRVVVQKPTIKRTKRTSNNEPVFTFNMTGTSDTAEAAKKDAIDQAAAYIAGSLELRQMKLDKARLEQLVTETRDGSEGFLGTSDGKDLGDGKQVLLTFELPSDYVHQLMRIERGLRMEDRMGWLSRGLAVIVAGLFAISGYVRLDEWSKGYFSGVLKAAAVFAVIASVVGVYYLR